MMLLDVGAIRKSSPVIVGSLLLLLIALTFSIIGSTNNDFKIIVSAIIYIFSGQWLLNDHRTMTYRILRL